MVGKGIMLTVVVVSPCRECGDGDRNGRGMKDVVGIQMMVTGVIEETYENGRVINTKATKVLTKIIQIE